MSVEQFIDKIAGKGLLDEALLQRLRRDATAAGNQWNPQDVIKFLVEQGHLTRFQGKNLLKELQVSEPAAHESLDLAASESIDGLSIGVVGDDDEDDEEIIDLEAALPANVANEQPQQVENENFDPLQTTAPQTLPVQQSGGVSPLQPGTMPADTGMPHPAAETPGEVVGYEDVVVPVTLLDKQFNNQIWDKRFIYATIVVLMLLVGGAGIFYFIVNSKSADVKFKAASEAYDTSQYERAIIDFAEFAKQFPTNTKTDEARALVYLSRIHQAIGTNQAEAIGQVEKAITSGKDIPGFSSLARDELKVLLPRFSEMFLGRAETANILNEKAENYELAVDALNLINLPGALGTTKSEPSVRAKLEELQERMAGVKRHIDRDTHLSNAMSEMSSAVAENEITAAFESRFQLHKLYPELKGDRRLSSVLSLMLDTERSLVREVPASWKASTDAVGLPVGRAVTATNSGESIAGAEGQKAVLAGGNVVALNLSNGSVLWQQFVGLQTALPPIQIGASSVFASSEDEEVFSVRSADGTLNWRLPVDGAITSVSANGGKVVVTLNGESGGVLLLVDSINGNIEMQVNTSLGLRSAPAFNRDSSVAYLIAEHSYLYAIGMEAGKCLDVHFLKHGIGAVPYPPVVVNDYIIVAQNLNNESGLVALRQEGLGPFAKSGGMTRVPGMLSSELVFAENRLVVATETGEVRLFDVVSQEDLTTPVIVPLAATTLENQRPSKHFVEMKAGSVRIAAAGLMEMDISDDGQLGESSGLYPDDVFVARTQTIGSVVIAQRKRVGASAITVSGMTDTGQSGWETDLASLSDSVIVANGPTAVTVDSQAQIFDIQKGGNAEIGEVLTSGRGYSHAVVVGKQLVLQSLTGSPDLLLFDAVGEGEAAKLMTLQNLSGAPAGPGVAFSNQLLLPLVDGQIALVDVTTGEQALVAYQPVKQPGEVVRWSVAALPSDNANSFVIVRDRKALQKIGVSSLPVPHLELQSEATFDVPVYNQVAATGETVYLIRRGRNNDEIVGLSYDSLEELRVQEVAGRVVWGPYRVGDLVLVYTSASRVYCFDGQQQLLWRSEQIEMSPVGTGIEEGDNFLLTGVGGILWRINVKTGVTVSDSQLGKKVIGAPFVVAGEVWVPTETGVVSGTVQ